MAVSVRMDPLLEQDLASAAKRQGLTKSQFIVDAVERALGRKDPYELLVQVEREMAPLRAAEKRAVKRNGATTVSSGAASHSARYREALRVKHEAELRDWAAFHGKKAAPAKRTASKRSTRRTAA